MHIIIALAIFWISACTIRAGIFCLWVKNNSRKETPNLSYPESWQEWVAIYIGAWCIVIPNEIAGVYGYCCDRVNPPI